MYGTAYYDPMSNHKVCVLFPFNWPAHWWMSHLRWKFYRVNRTRWERILSKIRTEGYEQGYRQGYKDQKEGLPSIYGEDLQW
jgi:hypothetical protein